MKSVFTSSFVVLALLALDSASIVAGRRHSLSGRRRHNRRACSAPSLPPVQSPTATSPPETLTEPQPVPTSTQAPETSGSAQNSAGLVKSDFLCGGKPSGAILEISQRVGPNGEQDWLNCGLSTSPEGWNPPPLKLDDIVYVNLDEALKDPNTPYKACEPYLDVFNRNAQKYNIPPIFIAAFALQESSCNPDTVGGAGEQGMMQITTDKCGGAPEGNCRDLEFNVGVGAKYFADTLAQFDGDVLLTIGQYNGWTRGLTEEKARSIKDQCCFCQQNLDYMMQYLNGWLQNKDAYSSDLGYYNNYEECQH